MAGSSRKKQSDSEVVLKVSESEADQEPDALESDQAEAESTIDSILSEMADANEDLVNLEGHFAEDDSPDDASSEDSLDENMAVEMEAMSESEADPNIDLEPVLSIQNVVKLYDKLKRSYAANDSLKIDASQVTSVDTATLQMLVALKKDAAKKNKSVVLFQPSDRFIESARLLDLLAILEIEYT